MVLIAASCSCYPFIPEKGTVVTRGIIALEQERFAGPFSPE